MSNDKAVEAAHAAYAKTTGGMLKGPPMANAISAYLSALPGEAEVVERLRKLTSPDAEILSDGYRLTEIIKLNPADALQAMQARAEKAEREYEKVLNSYADENQRLSDAAEAAEEAENEAKDCFWAIYPKYLEMGGEPIDTEAARTDLAKRAEAAEARVKELEAENARLRRLDAEYGRVETAIIMADPDFDGDSPHDNCGDRLIASVHRLRDLASLTGGSNG